MNQKGGTGKTTVATNIAACLAEENMRVLLIDMDPQAHATECIADPLDPNQIEPSIRDLLIGNEDIRNTIHVARFSRNLHYIPSTIDLLIEEYRLGSFAGIDPEKFKIKIDPIRDDYDYILCDCPPNLGFFTRSALRAADHVVVPMEPEPLAYRGLETFMGVILPDVVMYNPNLRVNGVIIVNRAPGHRKYLPEEIKRRIVSGWGQGFLFRTEIPLDVKVAESPKYHIPVSIRIRSSTAAQAFRLLTQEFIQRIPP